MSTSSTEIPSSSVLDPLGLCVPDEWTENPRVAVLGLLLECPVEREHPNCALARGRTGSTADRINFAQRFSEAECAELMARHLACPHCPRRARLQSTS